VPEGAVTQVERVLALKTFDAFRDLAPVELAALADNARPRRFKKGQALLRPGLPARSLHFILRGKVEVSRRGEPPVSLGPQDVVGGLAALIGDEQSQHAYAVEPTTTLQLHRDDLQDVFEDNFPALLGVLRTLARAQLEVRRGLGKDAGFPLIKTANPARPIAELSLVDKLFFLRKALDFAQSRVEALADLAQETRTLRAAEGQVLWSLGALADHTLLLIEGVIGASSENEEQVFEFGPGDVVGGIDALAGEPRWYQAVARTPITALQIGTQHLLDVIEDNGELGMDLLRVFASTLRALQGRLPAPPNQPLI
jgi:CRP-like cAMP-binding protein